MSRDDPDWGELVSAAVHDLRGPLGVVTGYTQMLARESSGSLNPSQQEIVEAIRRAAELITRSLESLSTVGDLVRGDLSLALIETEMATLLTPLTEIQDATLPVKVQGTAGAAVVRVDPMRLRSALMALLRQTATDSTSSPELVVMHGPHHQRPGRVVIVVGPAQVVEAMTITDDRRESSAPTRLTLEGLLASKLIEAQGGRLHRTAAGACVIDLPLASRGRADAATPR